MYIAFVYFSTPISCTLQAFLPLHSSHCILNLSQPSHLLFVFLRSEFIASFYGNYFKTVIFREIRLQWKDQFVGMQICRNLFINFKNTAKILIDQKKKKKNAYSEWHLQVWLKPNKSSFALLTLIWNLEVSQLCLTAFIILSIGPKWLNKLVSRPLFSFEKPRFWNLWMFASKMKSSFCVIYC